MIKSYTLEDYIITEDGEIYNKHNNHKVKGSIQYRGIL